MFRRLQAAFRLILAYPSADDVVSLLQAAGRDHVPVNTSSKPSIFSEIEGHEHMPVPDPKDRPTVDAIITEISSQKWYIGQIVYKRVFEEKMAQTGQ
jgi:DEAD/DEAH box helicase domain-containing protein